MHRLLAGGFKEGSDRRFEAGDCEAFAVALVQTAERFGMKGRVLYGYRDQVPELDGDDAVAHSQEFSHAVAQIEMPDGTAQTFDYRGKEAQERWEERFTPQSEFHDVRTGKPVGGLVVGFDWDAVRRDLCHREPPRRADPRAVERLESLLTLFREERALSLGEEALLIPSRLPEPRVKPRREAAAPAGPEL